MSAQIITLPAAAAGAASSYEYTLTPDGQRVAGHASVPAPLLPALRRGDEVVAVVPATRLSWHAVTLPKGVGRQAPRLRPVLEGLLEDRLLDDPAQLHLALAPGVSSDGRTWVAACDRQWLHAHLQALEAAQHPVTRIVPQLAPSESPVQLHATGEADQPLWLASGQGLDSGVLVLPLSPAALALLPALPEDSPVTAEPAVAAMAEQALHHGITLQPRAEVALQASRTDWDLAQLEFASSGRARTVRQLQQWLRDLRHQPAWRPARWGLALLLLAHLVGLNAWAWKEQSALQARRQAIRDTLTQTFPQVRVIVDAPLQMAREVAALRQATGTASGRDLESLLSTLATAAPELRGATALEFTDGQVRLKGLALGADRAGELSARLQSQGYTARADGDAWLIQQGGTP